MSKYEMPAAWGGSVFTDLTVPSGGVVQAKRIDLEDIVASGLIDEFDKLSGIVDDKVIKPAQGRRPQDHAPKKPTKAQAAAMAAAEGRAFMRDKESTSALLRMMALMLPQIVLQPTIYASLEQVDGEWCRIPMEDRIKGRVYVDSIPLADQMFIITWAMEGLNTEDLESFREQPDAPVGDVVSVQSNAGATE
jgi:hypothetical protein